MGNNMFLKSAPQQESPATNTVDETAAHRFQLLAKLVSTPDAFFPGLAEFQELEELIHEDFLKLCSDIGIPGESMLFNRLLLLLNDLKEVVEFPYLANRTVLAIGGGFSSGKSRFLNTVMGMRQLLPEGIQPTTAIPTFLTYGEQESILALNTFDRREPMTRDDLQEISHAFNLSEVAQAQGTISFYHILKLLQIQSPNMKWQHIALLDTPGYSKAQNEDNTAKRGTEAGNTDAEKAREHLSQADELIWAIPATAGTFPLSDLEFLRQKVHWDKPLYLLITKADQRHADLEKIFTQIQDDAQQADLKLAGISAYSSRTGKVYMGDDPQQWFEDINQKCKYTRWRGSFKAIFDQIIAFNQKEASHCQTLEKGLRPVFLKGDEELFTEAQLQQLKQALDDFKKERHEHARATERFQLFSQKVEQKLSVILQQLNITDETAELVGVEGHWMGASGTLPEVKTGDEFPGAVKRISHALNKLYVAMDGWNDLVSVKLQSIQKHYASMEEWQEGKNVTLTVYDVDNAQNQITFNVKPSNDTH